MLNLIIKTIKMNESIKNIAIMYGMIVVIIIWIFLIGFVLELMTIETLVSLLIQTVLIILVLFGINATIIYMMDKSKK